MVLGAALLALAYGLWTLKGKLAGIKGAIDSGFQSVEDGITTNLLSPGAGIDRATDFLNKTAGVLDAAKADITTGKDIVLNDVVPIMQDSSTILDTDVGPPVQDVGGFLTKVGNAIDIDILGAHPLHAVAKPFKDAGNDLTDIGNKCVDIGNKIGDAATKVTNAANSMDAVANEVSTVSNDVKALVPLVNVSLRNGLKKMVNDLGQARASLGQLLQVVSGQAIAGLVVAGILLIAAGVALGP
jgi:hypothetical protein